MEMIGYEVLTATFALRAIEAADAFVRAREGERNAKRGLINRTVEAIVARLLSDETATPTIACGWHADTVKNEGCKSTLAAYRSAIKWRLDNATVAALRALVTPEAATDPEAFEAVALAAAESLGDVWADYKAAKAAEKKARDAAKNRPPAAATLGFTGKAPEPKTDPIEAALTSALDAIRFLKSQGASDALESVFAALADETAEAEAQAV